MPMYDFECKACGHSFETIARLDETPACPKCASPQTERLMGAPLRVGVAGVYYSENSSGPGRPKRS